MSSPFNFLIFFYQIKNWNRYYYFFFWKAYTIFVIVIIKKKERLYLRAMLNSFSFWVNTCNWCNSPDVIGCSESRRVKTEDWFQCVGCATCGTNIITQNWINGNKFRIQKYQQNPTVTILHISNGFSLRIQS